MNDEQANPPPEDSDGRKEGEQLPKTPQELQDTLRAIQNDEDSTSTGDDNAEQSSTPPEHDVLMAAQEPDSVPSEQKLPRSEAELRSVVREIVQEVLEDVDAVRKAVAEPVDIVTIPQMMIPRLQLSPRQILSAVAAAIILIGGPITWAVWPRSVDLPNGAVGLWRTVTPSYSDAAFRLTPTTLTIHQSPQDSTLHTITRVTETEYLEEEGTTEYTVFYMHYRDQYEFSFLYREEPDTTIRFPHQREMTWRKVARSSSLP